MSEAAQSVKKRRGMLGFYVAAGMVLALVIAYGPLRTLYAIHAVRTTRWVDLEIKPGSTSPAKKKALLTNVRFCREAALAGSSAAVEALVDAPMVLDDMCLFPACEALFAATLERPQVVFDILEHRSASHVHRLIANVRSSALEKYKVDPFQIMSFRPGFGESPSSPQYTISQKMQLLVTALEKDAKAHPSSEVKQFSQECAQFLRRRFSSELEEEPEAKVQQ